MPVLFFGGQVDKYKGAMPGIAEEAILSLRAKQPLFIMGALVDVQRYHRVSEYCGI